MTIIYQKAFVVGVPVEQVWRALTDLEELNKWFFPIAPSGEGDSVVNILGSETTFSVREFDAPNKIVYADTGAGLWPAVPFPTETTIVLEAIDTGTRFTITRSGFGSGEDWEHIVTAHRIGTDEGFADLILYLETGVALPRHPVERSWHGLFVEQAGAGLRVRAVQPTSFADRLGLQPGDLLVELGGAPVFGHRELMFFVREHSAGETAAAAWVRDRALMRSSAVLGTRAEADRAMVTAAG